jgi:hypothetical protein
MYFAHWPSDNFRTTQPVDYQDTLYLGHIVGIPCVFAHWFLIIRTPCILPADPVGHPVFCLSVWRSGECVQYGGGARSVGLVLA